LALLSGCAHSIDIISRSTGASGRTTITMTMGHPSGEMSIVLGGKTYTGRWVYMSGGGSVSIVSATAFSGSRTASVSGWGIGVPTGGNGSMSLSSSDGSHLSCAFDYSEWSSSGVGVCQDEQGGMYDLQIANLDSFAASTRCSLRDAKVCGYTGHYGAVRQQHSDGANIGTDSRWASCRERMFYSTGFLGTDSFSLLNEFINQDMLFEVLIK
jgi:hypothetical protein